ncbi:MAG: hypothetical protein E6Q98_15005 [Rhodospirillaceae bacterium]|nr:MAG: hypothetical protein E6Q98_15005 [Rhodospirillaceae bacterium]
MDTNEHPELESQDDSSWLLETLPIDIATGDPALGPLLTKLHESYISSGRDKRLSSQFDRLVDSAVLPQHSGAARRLEGRALFVMGESGAGKSRSLSYLFSKRPNLNPYETEIGTMRPLVSVVAPSPCTLRQLANEILDTIEYKTTTDLKENIAWRIVKQQLKQRRTIILHIDEVQHCLQNRTDHESQKLLDTLKNLMQSPDWPVCLVLSGLPEFGKFARRDKQIPFRSRMISLPPLSIPADLKWVKFMVKAIFERLELDISALSSDTFYLRLCHAASNLTGRIARFIQGAGEEAIYGHRNAVTVNDFAEFYAAHSACDPDENIFLVRDWHLIDPNASLDVEDEEADDLKRGRKRGRK